MTLEEWAKKAREELGRHTFVTVSDGEYDEDFNDDDVIALCDEYDKLVALIHKAIPEVADSCPTCKEPKDRNSVARIIGEDSKGPLYCPNGFHDV